MVAAAAGPVGTRCASETSGCKQVVGCNAAVAEVDMLAEEGSGDVVVVAVEARSVVVAAVAGRLLVAVVHTAVAALDKQRLVGIEGNVVVVAMFHGLA